MAVKLERANEEALCYGMRGAGANEGCMEQVFERKGGLSQPHMWGLREWG